ncbi:hypothetical protein ACP275_12G047900 [Erythranthe tilingii]
MAMATTATVNIVVKPSSSIPCFGSLTKEICAQIEEIQSGCAAKEAPAWNKPSDVGVAAPEVAPVMGDAFWPDLSESLKSLSHGSITTPEGMAAGSLSSKKEDGTTSASTPNLRHKSVKQRSGGSNQSSKQANNGSLYQPPPPLPAQGAIIGGAPPANSGGGGYRPMESNRENTYRDGGVGFTSYRNIGGPRPPPPLPLPPQVDGLYHGVRPKHDPHRSYGIQHRGVRPFIRGPPPPIAHFVPPPPPPPPFGPRPIVNPMVYQDVPPPPPPPPHFYYVSGGPPPRQDFFRPMPMPMRMPMLPIPPMFFPVQKPGVSSQILKQIEYYFSNDNLVKDIFLRENMDAEGWVSIKLIAGFRKMMQLTDSIQLIKDSMQSSNVVEVQADKLRRKNDWSRWIILLPAQSAST